MAQFISPEEMERLEQLETVCAYLSNAWEGLDQIRLYLYQTCQHGTVIKGADAAELFCAVEQVMQQLDGGWVLIREERAKGTRVEVHPLFFPLP